MRVHQGFEKIFAVRAGAAPLFHDAAYDFHHAHAGTIATAHRGERPVWFEEGDEVDAAFKVVIQVGEFGGDAAAELVADQAAAGDKNGQLVRSLEQIDLASIGPFVEISFGF